VGADEVTLLAGFEAWAVVEGGESGVVGRECFVFLLAALSSCPRVAVGEGATAERVGLTELLGSVR
jgi:hypothetical protein